jgi:hypothetical protein
MNKSVIIIISAVWLFSTAYFTLARTYSLPYVGAAMVGSWVASALLLILVVIYIRRHSRK